MQEPQQQEKRGKWHTFGFQLIFIDYFRAAYGRRYIWGTIVDIRNDTSYYIIF